MNKDIEKSMRTMCHQVQYVNKTREKLKKKNQIEILESKIIEMRTLGGLTGRSEQMEERIRKPDNRSTGIVSWRNKKEKNEGK